MSSDPVCRVLQWPRRVVLKKLNEGERLTALGGALFFSPLLQEMAKEDPVCAPESMGSEDMLFLLYTSGSTGTPKGLVHTQAGYLLYVALTHRVWPQWLVEGTRC